MKIQVMQTAKEDLIHMVLESQITKFITVTIRVSDVLEADVYPSFDIGILIKKIVVRTIKPWSNGA